MRSDDEIQSLLPVRVAVGLSQVIGVTVTAGQIATTLKYFSGGSLEIVSGNTASPWGLGYLLGTTETYNANMIGTLYLAASGATAIAHVVMGKTSGN